MFHRPSFSPVSFSRISFNGATQPVEQSGRSGYWRLFYYQMQEETLKGKDEEPSKPYSEPYKLEEKGDGSAIVHFPGRKKFTVERTEPEIPTVPLGSVKTSDPVIHPELPRIWQITQELRTIRARWGIMQVASHQLDAVNDEDDIELLLLVA